MSAQEINVPDLFELRKQPDDPRWSLPAVAFLRDGSVVRLGGRSLREADEEVTRAGDSDIYIDDISADALRNLGVVLPDTEEPSSNQQVSSDAAADGAWQTADKWAQVYVAACGEVLSAANACLEVANRAVGARRKIVEHQNDGLPGTPIAIRNFTSWAEEAEQEFAPLYRAFAESCADARDTAASFLAAQTEPNPEIVLMMKLDEDVLDNVAMAKEILRADYGPTPSAFLQGVQESNELMQDVSDDGNIYRPPATAQSDERTCTWCAETIKAAAVICRFCGRDVQVQPNAG